MKFLILGSCVTRDAFEDRKEEIEGYFARSSWISLMSEPIEIEETQIVSASRFQKRMIYYDFNKSFFKALKEKKYNYILIDLIEERFNLLEWQGKIVTQSSELLNSRLSTIPIEEFNLVRRFSEDTHQRWELSCQKLVEVLRASVDEKNIILHRATWATQYKEDEKIISFPKEQLPFIALNNQILNRYYDYLEKHMSGMQVIKIKEALILGDKGHQWGLTPYHYCQAYYESFKQELKMCSEGDQ